MFLPRVSHLFAFIRLGRPHFLGGGFILYGLGVAIAIHEGVPFRPGAFVWGQIAVTAVQLMTHYANDYFDLDADRANTNRTHWSGGSGVLVSGVISPGVALLTALCLAAVAISVIAILAFVLETGALSSLLLLLSLLLAWFYSAPPARLHSTGLGEASAALVVAVLTPLVGYTLQAGNFSVLPILVAIPLALFQFAMLIIIEFPDAAGDRLSHKRTLVVRLGKLRAARLHNLALLLAYASLPLLVLAGLPVRVALVILIGLPLAGRQFWRMANGAWAQPSCWNSLGFTSIVLLIGTAFLEGLVFIGSA